MKTKKIERKKFRVRNKVKKVSSSERYRLSVSRSSRNISAQIIDDKNNLTLVSASSSTKEIKAFISLVLEDAETKVKLFLSSMICALIFLLDLLTLSLYLSEEETFFTLFLTLNFFLSIFLVFIISFYPLFLKYIVLAP